MQFYVVAGALAIASAAYLLRQFWNSLRASERDSIAEAAASNAPMVSRKAA